MQEPLPTDTKWPVKVPVIHKQIQVQPTNYRLLTELIIVYHL